MMMFWILAALATSLAALLVFGGARRGAGPQVGAMSTAVAGQDAEAVVAARRELDGLDVLKAAGQMSEDTWQEARAEAGRRWLERPSARTVVRVGRHDRRLVAGGVVVAVATTLGLYFGLANPGYSDQPYAARVDTWANSTEALEPVQVAAVLEREVRATPGDRRMLTLLGSARFQAGDAIGAASAFRRALALDRNDAQSWARLGESLVRSADGQIGGDAEAAFHEALRRDPDQLGARFFLGELALTRGDRAQAQSVWGPLIAALEVTDPRRQDLERRLASGEPGTAR